MGTRSRHTAQDGISLIEVMLAAVFGLAVLGGVLSLIVSNARLQRADEELVLAMQACRDKLEQLRSIDFKDLAAENNTGFAVGSDSLTRTLKARPDDMDGLPGHVDITVEDSLGSEILYKAVVRVDWDGVSTPGSFSMTGFLADRRRRK